MSVKAPPKNVLRNARKLQDRGQFDEAIAAYETAIARLLSTPVTPKVERNLGAAVEQTLRLRQWNREYRRALDLLDELRRAAPTLAQRFDVDAASLLIALGDEADGVAQFERLISADPDNIYLRSALGAELISLRRYEEAEKTLRAATLLEDMPDEDRARAYWMLFELYRRKPDLDQAEAAWRAGCALDATLDDRRPDVIRAFIYQRHFSRAATCVQQETNPARQYFYGGLCEFNNGNPISALKVWRLVADGEIGGIDDCPDEYAEACLYLNEPRSALNALRPLVDKGEISVWRLLILGLAYALMVDIPHARHYLDIALRLADSARPRETRRGRGDQIIHSGPARWTYGQIITATDLRAALDVFFIPLPAR